MSGADEGLDDAHPGQVFLEDHVEPVEALLDLTEQRLGLAAEQPGRDDGEGDKKQHHQGQPRTGDDQQDHGPDRPDRCAG